MASRVYVHLFNRVSSPIIYKEINTGVNNDISGGLHIWQGFVGLSIFLHHFSSGRLKRAALFLSFYQSYSHSFEDYQIGNIGVSIIQAQVFIFGDFIQQIL
jgi:hypothetical protein